MSKSIGNVVSPNDIVNGDGKTKRPAFGADVLRFFALTFEKLFHCSCHQEVCLTNYCVLYRWWVATQGSADDCNIPISNTFLHSADESVQKVRNVLRFVVGFCNEGALSDMSLDTMSYDELMYTDQYMLLKLKQFQRQVSFGYLPNAFVGSRMSKRDILSRNSFLTFSQVDEQYESLNYHRVLMKVLHFATTEISAQYFTWIKDRYLGGKCL